MTVPASAIPLSLYIHFPWCIKKCPYCDFNSFSLGHETIPETKYIQSLLLDLESQLPAIWGRRLFSIFLGGGTPSLFKPESLEQLFNGLQTLLPWRPDMEVTLEANPGTIDMVRFSDYRALGINRLSLGIQSFNNRSLKQLGRIHDAQQAQRAIDFGRKAGFDNINIDLMHGLPNQTLDDGVEDIRIALSFVPEHISYYQLTIEPNTFFYHHPPKLPGEQILDVIQEHNYQQLSDNGYQQYEISAFSKAHSQCRHNRCYWEFGDYLGLGAGAHGKLTDYETGQIIRQSKLRHPTQYMDAFQKGLSCSDQHTLSDDDKIFEFMLNALRLKDGVPTELFEQRTLLNRNKLEPKWRHAVDQGWLVKESERLACTDLGWRYLNDVLTYFLPSTNSVT